MTYTFLPNNLTARTLRLGYKTELKDSYIEMLTQLVETKMPQFPETLISYFSSLSVESYNSFFSFIYHKSIELLEESRFDETSRFLQFLMEPKILSATGLVQAETISREIRELIYEECSNSKYSISIGTLDREIEAAAYQRLAFGRTVLTHAQPELAQEIDELVQSVTFFVSRRDNKHKAFSVTSNRIQGLILINGDIDPSWIFLLDKWIHEAAHTYLFAINLSEELVLNDEHEGFSSPLRQDKRTMLGVYHATFVIQRLILAFSAIMEKSSMEENDRQKIGKLLTNYYSRLEDGISTVRQHGELSVLGKRLIEEGYRYAQEISRSPRNITT
ncbi:aKG-HExxH-type peptide beta-hydroxylase [Collimonas sp.]|uniref:aKG-HExxH-type peptide beta-hydroxylase n=1 Tax=Collimonas sp. TaxID=1963772 RepID=UPI002C4BCF13|nr:HEXXH motif-containing putative peptide modification protein [Collimonas sp.]HWW05490.1 HEXXH motif-containing putative peptide modification protein [Collimonas sp.]